MKEKLDPTTLYGAESLGLRGVKRGEVNVLEKFCRSDCDSNGER